MGERNDYASEVASRVIAAIMNGTAPWVKPWNVGELEAPYNFSTGRPYSAINSLHLASQGYLDPRWMTYRQAQSMDAQVRKGEHGTGIIFVKKRDIKVKRDPDGTIWRDREGNPLTVEIKLPKPIISRAVVFNAAQIDGLPDFEKPTVNDEVVFEINQRLETLVSESGAKIAHDGGDSAYYNRASDSIHLPDKAAFSDASGYYSTLLHELSHWTGHYSRLSREGGFEFGSEGYAKEEIRAELASFMLAQSLGAAFNPGPPASYIHSWTKALNNDPMEVSRAATDAQKIHDYIARFDVYEGSDTYVYDLEALRQAETDKQATSNKVSELIGVDCANFLASQLSQSSTQEIHDVRAPMMQVGRACETKGSFHHC